LLASLFKVNDKSFRSVTKDNASVCFLVEVNNEFCKPRPTLVAIDNPDYNFFPYFVKLHRCGGSCDNVQPSVQSCTPLQYNIVPVTVQVIGTSETKIINEKNHTRCGCECVVSPDNCNLELEDWRPDMCQCKCKYNDTTSKPCGQGMIWSKSYCRCRCNKAPEQCGANKVKEAFCNDKTKFSLNSSSSRFEIRSNLFHL